MVNPSAFKNTSLKKEHFSHAARDSVVKVNEFNALGNYVT